MFGGGDEDALYIQAKAICFNVHFLLLVKFIYFDIFECLSFSVATFVFLEMDIRQCRYCDVSIANTMREHQYREQEFSLRYSYPGSR